MRLPWTRSNLTDAEHTKAIARPSTDWASEIRRLTTESDQLAVERAAVVVEAGQATLDRQAARASDLTRRITEIDAQVVAIGEAIRAAEGRQADAEADEERRRQSSQLRRYHQMLATWLTGTATVKEAEAALTAAVRARNEAVDGETINSLYHALTTAGVRVTAREDVLMQVQTPASLRALAERHQELARTATLDPDGATITSDEVIDQAAIPLTPKELEVAAIEHARAHPPRVTHAVLEALDAELKAVRETAKRAAEQRNADRFTWAAKAEHLQIRRADMAVELAEIEAVAEGVAT
jgi:hypothetical protein